MAAYLTDAGTLHVDVLRAGDMSIIGKVQIYGLSTLAAGKPLDGYASCINATLTSSFCSS